MSSNHKIFWHKFLDIIRQNLADDDVYVTWFEPAKSVSFENGALTIEVPSEFFCEQYEGRFRSLFNNAILQVYGRNTKIKFQYYIVKNDPDTTVTVESSEPSESILRSGQNSKLHLSTPFSDIEYEDVDSQLNPIYNFENYCVGESNKLVFTIAESIGDNPSKNDFNPFFLYGNTGVGKTHLIQAIGVRVKELYEKARVLYVTSKTLSNQYGTAVRHKRTNDFTNFYQSIDVLLIDDIQELAGKDGTQKAFFHIFNHLHQNGKLLIMTSDRPPVELEGLMDRLLNRFKWGITEVLPNPDIALRKQILRHKAAKSGLQLPEEVVDIIAGYVTNSVRELEGIVMSLITRATILNQPITPALAQVVMQSAVKITKPRINFDMIVEATASHFNIDVDVIFSKNRVRDIAEARQIIMFLSNKLTDLSSSSIGVKLARTHATVLHGISTVKNRIDVDKNLADAVKTIETSLLK